MCHTTAALSTIHEGRLRCLLLLLQCCTFGCILLIPFQLFPLSTAPLDAVLQFCRQMYVKCVYRSSQVSATMCVHVCVSNRHGDGDSISSAGTAINTAEISFLGRGWAGPCWRGQGTEGVQLYLSPRMAYWLSSCNCCIEAPLFSSLPRFRCFTTSKVFSISLSLKRRHGTSRSNCGKPSTSQPRRARLFSLNSTYLRVSTCLAVASREGNCASLKISGGAWLCTRLVVVSRAPGGR